MKKLFNINFIIDRVFERTNDRPGQPEEPGKPEINPKTVLFPKLYINVCSLLVTSKFFETSDLFLISAFLISGQ